MALVYGEGRLRFVAVDLAGWRGGVLVAGGGSSEKYQEAAWRWRWEAALIG